jgi:hypothetical protein
MIKSLKNIYKILKIIIQKLYDCVDLTVNYNNPIMDNDNSVEELEDNSELEFVVDYLGYSLGYKIYYLSSLC